MFNLSPLEIEKKSFEIITQELGQKELDPIKEPIIKRVIHTTADFSYADNLYFSENAVQKVLNSIKNGVDIVTDTKMAAAGINKNILKKFGGNVYCYIDDDRVIVQAKQKNTTRSAISMELASTLNNNCIFVIGNAPTALIKLYELVTENKLKPEFIIGVPVGFVNVVEAKELIIKTDIPCIVSRGRKGGSNVAAAICNALLYSINKEEYNG